MTTATESIEATRFWAKVKFPAWAHGCWEWTAHRNSDGYGTFRTQGRQSYAHRVVYEMNHGEIPDGLQIDHICRNRGCVNPAHLEVVTSRENTHRGLSMLKLTHCRRGHELAGYNIINRSDGGRQCRVCYNASQVARRARMGQTV